MKITTLSSVFAAALVAALAAGCATSPVERTEKMLTQSGFRTVPVSSPAQLQEVAGLPPGKISPVKRNGKAYFVYPDPARKVLYVGNKSQLHAYKEAVSNLRLEQDAMMERDEARAGVINEDIDIQSGALPSFAELYEGWPD